MSAAVTTDHDPVAHLVDALRDNQLTVTRTQGGWVAQCPAHDDRQPSLSISEGQDGRALVYCHAGCGIRDILDGLSVDPQALFADYDPTRESSGNLVHVRAWREKKTPPPKPPRDTRRHKTAHWDYQHPNGTPAARIVRYDLVEKTTGEIVGKTFTQHAINSDGGIATSLGGMDVPLYNAPAVAAAVTNRHPIFICEGEKDADTAIGLGLVGTTCAAGAGSWRPHHTAALAGAELVAIVADNDQPGIDHAHHIAAELADIGISARIYLPAQGNDLTDHVAAGLGIADLVAFDAAAEAARVAEETRQQFPAVDWHALWNDDSEEEWIVEPLLPARRLVALYSAPKVGKSLLMLELAYNVSQGRQFLGSTPSKPYRVLYVDFENDPKSDTRDRLKAMEAHPDELGNLIMLSFPTMAALDSPSGAEQLLAAVAAYQCEVVVVDTVSRAIKGDENENDTWLNFYRHTGLALKQAQVALIRLDHSGKDETKGQRGGSAKSGDVDAVWRMSTVVDDKVYRLDCEAARLPITEKVLVLHRHATPRLEHRVDATGVMAVKKAEIQGIIDLLDANGMPDEASNEDVREFLRERGKGKGNAKIAEAVKTRKARIPAWKQ